MADGYLSQSSPPSSARGHISHHHHHIRRHRMPSGGEEQEEEELDPRIQIELEKLNRASEEINRLELELDDARAAFRTVLSDSTQRLNGLAKKLGTCVDKARPYYDARMRLKEAHLESQKAALRFERACSMHEAAKEMVQLAEEGYKRREQDLDPTWQEMLNHATMKVNDAECERIESESFHQQTTVNFKHKEEEVHKLQKDLKRAITKSKPYFEMKAKFNQVMEDHKRTVSRLEEDVCSAKSLYSEALRSLEAISDDIHRQRLERRQKLQLGVRGSGVGAEAPSPPPSWEKGANIEGSASSPMFDGDELDDPLNSNPGFYSTEMMLDVEQLKVARSRGIVCHEPAYRKKTSLTDLHIREGNFKTDPLEVVVFKTSSLDYLNSAGIPKISDSFQPPSVIHRQPERARSASYRAAIESQGSLGIRDAGQNKNTFEIKEDDLGESVVTPTPENVLDHSFEVKSSHSVELEHRGPELNISGSPGRDSSGSPLSGSPKGSRKRDIELSQSSMSRAQEWVNKSPVPQQRRFVKSTSLIEDSGKSLSVTPPQHADLSLSLTTEAIKSMRGRENKDRGLIPTRKGEVSTSTLRASRVDSTPGASRPCYNNSSSSAKHPNEPVHLSTSPLLMSSQNNLRSLGSTPEQASPLSGSPPIHRKSPKLQGLILRVDASSIKPSSTSTSSQQSKDQTYSSANAVHNPKVIISTQHPKLGVFKETSPPSQSVPPVTEGSSQSSLPLPVKPPTSLISQHLNKMMNVTKVSAYNSKTAPSTLSTSYHLPSSLSKRSSPLTTNPPTTHSSPVRNPLSPIPPVTTSSLRHHLGSPIPSSPSGDRFSLSGRSDSMSASSGKGVFLKPPSDSSDTESIASTGPMLDDDQVELINMDFTEQSISTEINDDNNDNRVETADPASVPRGHWSRMSLPPRLSYLEGFLERARMLTGDENIETEEGSSDRLSLETNDEEVAGFSSAGGGGEFDDKVNDLSDVTRNHKERGGEMFLKNSGTGNGYETSYDLSISDNNSTDVSVTVELNLGIENSVGEKSDAKEHIDFKESVDSCEQGSSNLEVPLSIGDDCTESANGNSSTEATIVLTTDRCLEVNSSSSCHETEETSQVTEVRQVEDEESSREHFV